MAIRDWFKRPTRPTAEESTRTGKIGERLTEHEMKYVRRNICPDCVTQESFVSGPIGGMSINIACSKCGSEFNLLGPGAIMGVDRNSTKGAPNIERLRTVFQIDVTNIRQTQERG